MKVSTNAVDRPAPTSARIRRYGLVVLAAVLGATAAFLVLDAVVHGGVVAPDPSGGTAPLALVAVAVAALAGAAVGAAAGEVATRVLPRPRATVVGLGAAATLASLVGPLSADLPGSSAAALVTLHVVVGAVVVGGLARVLPAERRR